MDFKRISSSTGNIMQFIKFGIVGLANTAIGLAIYYGFLWLGVNYLISNAASWLISVLNAFYWNNNYVFKNNGTWFKSLVKTYISYGFSFLLGSVLLYVFVEWCGITKMLAPLLILLVTIPVNFLLNKFWTFR